MQVLPSLFTERETPLLLPYLSFECFTFNKSPKIKETQRDTHLSLFLRGLGWNPQSLLPGTASLSRSVFTANATAIMSGVTERDRHTLILFCYLIPAPGHRVQQETQVRRELLEGPRCVTIILLLSYPRAVWSRCSVRLTQREWASGGGERRKRDAGKEEEEEGGGGGQGGVWIVLSAGGETGRRGQGWCHFSWVQRGG